LDNWIGDINVAENNNTIIRPVEPGDAKDLRENCFSANTIEQVEARIAANRKAIEQGTEMHLVAEVAEGDGGVVGVGGLVRRDFALHAHRGELVDLVVHPHYRRQGIARRIVEGIKERAAAMGVEILEVGCRGGTPAEEVYRHLGFVEWGRLPRGLVEPWGEHKVYDEVQFYMPVE
jgi:GNAT superfamily N-acetyltransferase